MELNYREDRELQCSICNSLGILPEWELLYDDVENIGEEFCLEAGFDLIYHTLDGEVCEYV